jgi:hypothetical protein
MNFKIATTYLDVNKAVVLSDDKLLACERFIELSNWIYEIEQLYQVFAFNVRHLVSEYQINRSSKVITNKNTGEKVYSIEINSVTSNIITSGACVHNIMEPFINRIYKENIIKSEKIKKLVHKQYDEDFRYRFILRLRDYIQHRDLPICVEDGKCYLDLNQICFNRTGFRLNAKINNESKYLIERMHDEKNNVARLEYYNTLLTFVYNVSKLYYTYYKEINDEVYNTQLNFNKVKYNTPGIIQTAEDGVEYYIFKTNNREGNPIRAFSTEQSLKKLYNGYKKVANIDFNAIKKIYLNEEETNKDYLLKLIREMNSNNLIIY